MRLWLSLDDFLSNPSGRWIYYAIFSFVVVGSVAFLGRTIAVLNDQKEHAAAIRHIGEAGVAQLEIFSGSAMHPVHCATFSDPASSQLVADRLASAKAGISIDRTSPLYEFVFVVTDPAGRTVNLQGSIRTSDTEDVFIDFLYTGPAYTGQPTTWPYPVQIKGFSNWVVHVFETNDCPAVGARASGSRR